MKGFQVEDKVSYIKMNRTIKKGIVFGIDSMDHHDTIKVKLNNGEIETFTKEGAVHSTHAHRSLFHSHNIKVEITGEEEPERHKWVNVYLNDEEYKIKAKLAFTTKEEALESISSLEKDKYITTIQLKPKYK